LQYIERMNAMLKKSLKKDSVIIIIFLFIIFLISMYLIVDRSIIDIIYFGIVIYYFFRFLVIKYRR
jgi:hypothetical protein